jgi:hypothetical protein
VSSMVLRNTVNATEVVGVLGGCSTWLLSMFAFDSEIVSRLVTTGFRILSRTLCEFNGLSPAVENPARMFRRVNALRRARS